MAHERRATIRDVAALAGVSHQTVSRYLREDVGMRESVRERIARAVAELDYRPNVAARMMRTRASGRLALMLPLGRAAPALDILTGAREAAELAGYELDVIVVDAPESGLERRVLDYLDAGFFDGVVSLAPLHGLAATQARAPVVVTGDYDQRMHSTGALADATILRGVIERLARSGRERFLHLAGDSAHESARSRRAVYEATVADLGLTSLGVIECGWDARRAHDAIRSLPADSGVDAVVAAQDVLAAAAVRGALERGWRVPLDVAVTGWDDDPVAAYMLPSITSVATDLELVGRHAVGRLVASIRGEDFRPEDGPLLRVVWRESTGTLAD